ncbi:MAG: AAA family ATPase [Pseudomonadota bacterium]
MNQKTLVSQDSSCTHSNLDTLLEDARNILLQHGLEPQYIVANGEIQRCPTRDKPNSQNGRYSIGTQAPFVLWWHDWRSGEGGKVLLGKGEKPNYQQNSVAIQHAIEQQKRQTRLKHAQAAQNASQMWEHASAVTTHPYLEKKQVPSFGLRATGDGTLIIPVMGENGMQSLQLISQDGKSKIFLRGGRLQGGFYSIPAKDDVSKEKPLCIAEGYATAASIHMATGNTVVIAFNAGNLLAVAQSMRAKYTDYKIVVCADNDCGSSSNVGVTKAIATAKSIGAAVAIPPSMDGESIDFNDLHTKHGLERVSECIEHAQTLEPVQPQAEFSTLTTVGAGRTLRVVTAHELATLDVPNRGQLLSPVLPEQGLCMLYAARGIGKTYCALHMAYAVASGGSVFSWTAEVPQPVLYVDGEMPLFAMYKRVQGIISGGSQQPPEGFFRIMTPDLQGDVAMPNIATQEGQAAINQLIQDARLIVLDNISTLCRTGQANSEEYWLPVQEWILSLRRRGVTVLLVHHAGKNGSQRGTSAKEDILDTVIQLTRPQGYVAEDGARISVHLTKARYLHGDDAQDFEAQLVIEDGKSVWKYHNPESDKIAKIKALAETGKTCREIADVLTLSKSTVHRLCSRYNIVTGGMRLEISTENNA